MKSFPRLPVAFAHSASLDLFMEYTMVIRLFWRFHNILLLSVLMTHRSLATLSGSFMHFSCHLHHDLSTVTWITWYRGAHKSWFLCLPGQSLSACSQLLVKVLFHRFHLWFVKDLFHRFHVCVLMHCIGTAHRGKGGKSFEYQGLWCEQCGWWGKFWLKRRRLRQKFSTSTYIVIKPSNCFDDCFQEEETAICSNDWEHRKGIGL